MGETANQIRREIEEQREDLGENLQQLEHKVKRTADWRAQFDERPLTMIGVAFGGGLLLSSLAGGGKGKDHQDGHRSSEAMMAHSSTRPSETRSPERNEMTETIDNIRGALLGLAAREIRSFMATALPGFEQEYRETTDRRHASPATRLDESSQVSTVAPVS